MPRRRAECIAPRGRRPTHGPFLFIAKSPNLRKNWISRLTTNIVGEMISDLIACISAFFSAFSRHRDLALENLALRQQLTIFKRLWVPKMPSESFGPEFHQIDEFNFDSAFVNSDNSG